MYAADEKHAAAHMPVMTDDIIRKAQTGEPGNGGQFGHATHAEAAGVELAFDDDFEYAERQWTGDPTAVIESETDPWLKDANGEPIDLTFLNDNLVAGPCGNGGHAVPGVIAPMNSEVGIEACDECDIYSDLEAAKALADHIGGGAAVWFHGA